MYRSFFRLLLAACAVIVCGIAALFNMQTLAAEQGNNSRPNILFIMADDHAAHAIGAYGSRINKTPNIDRLAQEGMKFDNCFVTNSICAPSRACILTGKYSHVNGMKTNTRGGFDSDQPTLPKYLRAAGYHTGMIGKWHLVNEPTGFDYWNILPGQGVYHDPVFIEMGRTKKHTGYVTDLITDSAIEFIEKRPKDEPFFLMCHHKAPHRHWNPNDKYAKEFAGKTFPEPETFDDDYSTRSDAAREATMRVGDHFLDKDYKKTPPEGLEGEELRAWMYQRYMQDYLACIASVDENVGRLLDYLDRAGLADNTIVVYTSDQGFFLGDHGWFDKRFMYEESLRMPFLIRWPKRIKPGSTNDGMILNVDFAPTFLDAAGEKVPAKMQGRSFLPLLDGKTPDDWRTSMYYRYYEYPQSHRAQPHFGVRTDRYKLIYFDKLDQWELYDLQADPNELHNIYDSPAQAERVAELKAELKRLQKKLNDK